MVSKKRGKEHHNPEIKHQQFWAGLAIIFLISVITIITLIEDKGITGGAVQNIAYVQGGKELTNGVHGVKGVEEYTLTLKETIKNGQVVVEEDATIPFDQPYYSKFKVTSTDADKISTISFVLKAEKEELLRNGISAADVRLYANGEELVTTTVEKQNLIQEEGRYVYYAAAASQLGEFVIGRYTQVVEEVPVEETVAVAEPIVEETTAAPEKEIMIVAPTTTGKAASSGISTVLVNLSWLWVTLVILIIAVIVGLIVRRKQK